jgi:hypothetical protein
VELNYFNLRNEVELFFFNLRNEVELIFFNLRNEVELNYFNLRNVVELNVFNLRNVVELNVLNLRNVVELNKCNNQKFILTKIIAKRFHSIVSVAPPPAPRAALGAKEGRAANRLRPKAPRRNVGSAVGCEKQGAPYQQAAVAPYKIKLRL